MNRPNLRTLTTSLVTLMMPVTLLVSMTTTAYYKSTNPDNVDITQGLAYLQQSMTAAIITFVLFVVAIIAGIVVMYRRDRNFSNAKLPLVLLVSTCAVLAAAGLLNGYVSQVQDQYLIDNGRPTMQQFFDKLEEQDKN